MISDDASYYVINLFVVWNVSRKMDGWLVDDLKWIGQSTTHFIRRDVTQLSIQLSRIRWCPSPTQTTSLVSAANDRKLEAYMKNVQCTSRDLLRLFESFQDIWRSADCRGLVVGEAAGADQAAGGGQRTTRTSEMRRSRSLVWRKRKRARGTTTWPIWSRSRRYLATSSSPSSSKFRGGS